MQPGAQWHLHVSLSKVRVLMLTIPGRPFSAKRLWLYAALLSGLGSRPGLGQSRAQVDVYYDPIRPLLHLQQSGQALTAKLDSLPTTRRFSRSTISHEFDRDIDFGLFYRRTIIRTNTVIFQLDAVSLNGRLVALAAALASTLPNPIPGQNQLLQSCDTAVIGAYLARRNAFYQSRKSLPDFFAELQADEVYSLACGDGSPATPRALQLAALARQNRTATLAAMLGSIHCETQAYGVAGFAMIKRPRRILPQQRQLIRYIKQRNSVIVTCEGCLSGLKRAIY